jgi:hypothetical protein
MTVNAATAIPGTVGSFTLLTADSASGIVVNQPLSAVNGIVLIADTMSINAGVTSTAGNISVATNTLGRPIDLGSEPGGTLGFTTTEIARFSTPGTLFVGDGNTGIVTSSVGYTLSTVQNLSLTSGTNVTVAPNTTGPSVPGNLSIAAPAVSIGAITTANGNININGDTVNIASATSAGGDINIAPQTFRSITLGTNDVPGSTLGLTPGELNLLDPGPAGVLRIGDFGHTGNITVTAAIAPSQTSNLSLRAGNNLAQNAGATINIANLAASVGGSIILDEANNPGAGTNTVALNGSTINFTHAGTNPLNIGVVDGIFGVQTFGGNANVRSNEVNILANVSGNGVTFRPRTAGTNIDIGTKTPGSLSFTNAELGLIGSASAGTTFGDPNSGNIVVSAPINVFSFSDLILTTGAAHTATVNAAIGGNLRDVNINAGTINTMAAISSSVPSGTIRLSGDSISLGAPVSAAAVTLRPLTPMTLIDVGGVDGSGVLGLSVGPGSDLSNISSPFAGTPLVLQIGDVNTGGINVSAPVSVTGSATLSTGGIVAFNTGTFSVTEQLAVIADDVSIAPAAQIGSSGATGRVLIQPQTAGRDITLGYAARQHARPFRGRARTHQRADRHVGVQHERHDHDDRAARLHGGARAPEPSIERGFYRPLRRSIAGARRHQLSSATP